ncbi:MAG TPA: PAS domain S-box protein [Longimicrobiales bacterium]|nr:PAS domain S-box protein [Longimicrobiales bacterium]
MARRKEEPPPGSRGRGRDDPVEDASGRGDVAEEERTRLRLMESAVANAADAVVITDAKPFGDPGPGIVYVNEAFTQMTGYAADEVMGKNPRFLQGPDTDPAAVARIRPALERREPVRVELLNYRKDGSPFSVELSIVPVVDERGRVTHYTAIQRETTERRATEEALRRTNTLLQAVVAASPAAIVVVDAEGRIEAWNPAAERILGWSAAEVIGRPDPTVPAERAQEYREAFDRALAGGVGPAVESVRVRRDGTYVDVVRLTAPLREADGTVRGVVNLLEDVTRRHQAEAALRESEQLFRDAIDHAPIGMALVDREGRVIHANRAAVEISGYSERELRRLTFREISHPDDLAADQSEFRRLAAGEIASYQLRKRIIHKDGHPVWVRLTRSALRGPGGEPSCFITQIEDITESKAVEEGQRRLTAILEATTDLVGISDVRGHTVYLNRAWRELAGIPEEEVGQATIPDFHPEWAAGVILREGVPTAIREGSWTGETAVKTRAGEEIPVSQVILAHKTREGAVEFLSTVCRDISERKRLEEVQRFLAEASRTISGSLQDGAILRQIPALLVPRMADYCLIDLIDDAGEIRREVVFHRDPAKQELLEQSERYPPDRHRPVGIGRVLRTGEPEVVGEVTPAWLRAISQSEEHLLLLQEIGPRSVLIVPLRARGRIIGAITCAYTDSGRRYDEGDLAVAADLMERMALAIDNARLYQQVQQALRFRDEVLRVVAHDLRNPLHSIGLSAELLRDVMAPGALPPTRPDPLQIIQRSVERANALIQDLLDVARMQAGKLTMAPQPTDARAMVDEAVHLQRAGAEQEGLTMELQVPDRLPPISADRGRMSQVFANVIGNAIKFTPAGGRVTVTAEPEDGVVRFTVADTGPGIPREGLPHLFEPFWQAAGAEEGAGLGLGIARGIVEAHGGHIWAESEEGAGTTIHFTVPVASTENGPPDGAKP